MTSYGISSRYEERVRALVGLHMADFIAETRFETSAVGRNSTRCRPIE